MTATSLSARLCVAYTDETCGAATTWRFADSATGADYFIALVFARAWAEHNRRRERANACQYHYRYTTN